MAVLFRDGADVRQYLDDQLQPFGAVKYTYLALNKRHPEQLLLISSYPPEWVSIYSSNGYQRIDPVVRAAHCRYTPFLWHENPLTTQDIHYQKIFSQARDYGIVNGCSFVLHDHGNNLAMLSFSVQATNESDLRQLIEDERARLQMLLIDTHQRALTADRQGSCPTEKERLSPRESEILYWASRGKTYEEIALILGLKTGTVKFHIGNAVKKLGVLNAKHAIRLGIERQLIKPPLRE